MNTPIKKVSYSKSVIPTRESTAVANSSTHVNVVHRMRNFKQFSRTSKERPRNCVQPTRARKGLINYLFNVKTAQLMPNYLVISEIKTGESCASHMRESGAAIKLEILVLTALMMPKSVERTKINKVDLVSCAQFTLASRDAIRSQIHAKIAQTMQRYKARIPMKQANANSFALIMPESAGVIKFITHAKIAHWKQSSILPSLMKKDAA
jgi:hypothetical protein